MTIKILSEETINKIAAGEVIERPANAVKELVENSIDAKARNIEIEIKASGKELIRVTDDGAGMSREDLTLSVTRHATSKLSNFVDLDRLATLGFRGEALPSIASVSHLLIQSQEKSKMSGWEEKYAGGKLIQSRAWAGKPGTTVEVAGLFFNTPARNKFLKSPVTERHHIVKILEEIALIWNTISFKLVCDGKTILTAPVANTKTERFFDILGMDFSKKLMPVKVSHAKVTIEAYITKTQDSLPNRNMQFLFVNNRPVSFTRAITHSIYDAYRENLPAGRHPGILLYIDIEPSEIDVNIHPTKREVKFSNESQLHDVLYRSIKQALIQPVSISFDIPDKPISVETAKKEYFIKENYPAKETRYSTERSSIRDMEEILKEQAAIDPVFIDETSIRALGQVFNLFIIAQDKDEILIVDQHAAAERIRYEQYKNEWENKKIPVQPLLIPFTMELPRSKMELIRHNIQLLSEAGWNMEEFGKNTVRITQQPNVLGTDTKIQEIVSEIITALELENKLPAPEKIEKIIRAACRASIKANETLSNTEMNELINKLLNCKAPYTCPHGRPTMIKLSRNELSKKFRRT
ncbi:MAG: DNA mismatch repair endonuclease MutL [Elusimicrobia bacterium]|nr:DNA mismatch repair endonuclease MutL [Candidatus Liberimonas magnetica]